MKKFIYAVVIVFLIFAAGLFIGWWATRSVGQTKVSSQSILTALRDRGFLVTQTNVLNESIKISTQQDTFWQRLLWGQVINAYGVVEVNTGVDLAKLKEEDIKINGNKITVYIPSVEIFNSRLVGDITLQNSQGILKRIFENDNGYNQAMNELIKQATDAVSAPGQMTAANQKSIDEVARLVGYISEGKEVGVEVR
ncbi:MAG: DUF4230 domain-containing protein [Patescibacteria group bacterium]